MAQTQQVRGVATMVSTRDGLTTVTYHNTPVVQFNSEKVLLDTGGWKTVTTKARMNQAANQFDLGYDVFQKSGEWFINIGGVVLPFDGRRFAFDRELDH